MNKKALKALHGSVRKWIAIVEWRGVDQGADNCPLCKVYNNASTSGDCDGCPVKEATGRRFCGSTPYTDWGLYTAASTAAVFDEQSQRLAEEEALFLLSLLPEKEQARYLIKEKA